MSQADPELAEIADYAVALARRAGQRIMPYYRSVAAETKADGTPVTEADRRTEELIRAALAERFPGAAVLGEEFGGERRPVPGDQWIVDPIDGTAPFVLGLPLFGVLIGLLRDGDPVVGVAHMPALGETVYAARSHGCWYWSEESAPERVRCEPRGTLGEAFVSASGVHASEVEPADDGPGFRLAPLVRAARRFRVVGDCVQHTLVCRGRIHVALDSRMEPWDSAALVACVLEAGGAVAGIDGVRENVVFAGSLISASDEPLLAETLSCIRPAP